MSFYQLTLTMYNQNSYKRGYSMNWLISIYEALKIKVGIAYGSRCPKDGGKYYDAFQETKWHKGKCPNCGDEVKW